MRKKNNHNTALVFSTVLLVPLLCIVMLQCRQAYLKAQAWERLEESLAQTITLPAHKVVWEEKGKEIMLDGKLFDLEWYQIENGIFTAHGVYDDEETRLARILSSQGSASNDSTSIIQLLIALQLFAAFAGPLFTSIVKGALQKRYIFFFVCYTNPLRSIICPPPQLRC